MDLSPIEVTALFEAIVDSYSVAELRQLLFLRLDRTLERVSGANNLDEAITDILDHSKRHGWRDALIVALRESRPHVQLFRDISARIAPPAIDRGKGLQLQQLVSKQVPVLSPVQWRAMGEATERRVCLIHIETNDGYIVTGTGFLVAANLVLTARHVMADLFGGNDGKLVDLANVRIWFDRKHLADGKTLSIGTAFGLRSEQWHVASDEGLDYALLRLDVAAGDLPLGLKRIEEGAPRRGWISFPQPPVVIAQNTPLVIPQHGEGEPLTLALETQSVIGLEGSGARVVHRTNTLGGTSGAPCFDLLWNLVAMHVAARSDVRANEAVAITAIAESLRAKGIEGAGLACS